MGSCDRMNWTLEGMQEENLSVVLLSFHTTLQETFALQAKKGLLVKNSCTQFTSRRSSLRFSTNIHYVSICRLTSNMKNISSSTFTNEMKCNRIGLLFRHTRLGNLQIVHNRHLIQETITQTNVGSSKGTPIIRNL
jgi:hypothetical protein